MNPIEKNVADFREALVSFGIKDTIRLVADFKKMLTNKYSPSHYWNCIANGAFKECYDVGCDEIIVKFAADANETSEEQYILDMASNNDLSRVFIPSVYIALAVQLPVCYLEDSPSSEYRWTYHEYRPIPENERLHLTTVIIQRKVAGVAGDRKNASDFTYNFRYDGVDKEDYWERPIITKEGNVVDWEDIRYTRVESYNWVQDAILFFGLPYYLKLANFLQYYHISDLHDRNIGYLADGTPVIFDWLS